MPPNLPANLPAKLPANPPTTPSATPSATPGRRLVALVTAGVTAAVLAAGGLAGTGCRKTAPSTSAGPDPASSVQAQLPPLVVKAPGEGLTFSYITTDGGFQLARKIDDVPLEARDAVRVWSEISGDGIAGPWVYVADLRVTLPDGTYKVEVMARDAFEKMALDRRGKKPGEKGLPVAKVGGGDKDAPRPAAGAKQVILYGADWCKPCHAAEAYMKKRGIPYTHKDIDDPNVNEEMRDKLASAGLKSGSIPVFDVVGKILVGFSEDSLDSAWAAANK